MRIPVLTQFSKVLLSEDEQKMGYSLSQFQRDTMLNRRASIAEEIISLTYSSNKDDQYGLRLAELQGQLIMLSNIIDESDSITTFKS